MKTINVSEATNTQLDWLVAKCEGLPLRLDPMGFRQGHPTSPLSGWWVWYGTPESAIIGFCPKRQPAHKGYSPTTDWSQMGPIIERQELELHKWGVEGWEAKDTNYKYLNTPQEQSAFAEGYGETALIAAARCFVVSKLGETVEVPEELS